MHPLRDTAVHLQRKTVDVPCSKLEPGQILCIREGWQTAQLFDCAVQRTLTRKVYRLA